ncbi:hypothetical protein Tco_1376657 [Tanacetum coccineum]
MIILYYFLDVLILSCVIDLSADSAVTYTSIHSEARSWSIPSEDPYEEAAQQLLEQASRSPDAKTEDETPTPPPLPPFFLSLRIRPPRTRAAMAQIRATAPSTYHSLLPSGTPPLLPIPLPAPSTSRRVDIPEADTRPTMAHRVDYKSVDTMETRFRDTERRMMTALEMVNMRDRAQALEARVIVLETEVRRHEWQRQAADDIPSLIMYGYIRNHKKTIKIKQARTRERKSEQKPEAKPGKVKPSVKVKATLQPSVALSTTKAEYMALTEATKEGILLKGLIEDLGFPQDQATVFCDSMSAICLAKDQVYHDRTKHIDVHYHFIHTERRIKVKKISTEDNPADVFTKPVPLSKFCHCLDLLNIDNWKYGVT